MQESTQDNRNGVADTVVDWHLYSPMYSPTYLADLCKLNPHLMATPAPRFNGIRRSRKSRGSVGRRQRFHGGSRGSRQRRGLGRQNYG